MNRASCTAAPQFSSEMTSTSTVSIVYKTRLTWKRVVSPNQHLGNLWDSLLWHLLHWKDVLKSSKVASRGTTVSTCFLPGWWRTWLDQVVIWIMFTSRFTVGNTFQVYMWLNQHIHKSIRILHIFLFTFTIIHICTSTSIYIYIHIYTSTLTNAFDSVHLHIHIHLYLYRHI